MIYFSIFMLLMGLITTITSFITMSMVKSSCKDNTTIKNINYVNLGTGILLCLVGIGMLLFHIGPLYRDESDGFGFG